MLAAGLAMSNIKLNILCINTHVVVQSREELDTLDPLK